MDVEIEAARRELDVAREELSRVDEVDDALRFADSWRDEWDDPRAVMRRAMLTLAAEVVSLRTTAARVRELHQPSPLSGGDCATCRVPAPCRTVRELTETEVS